MTILDEAGARFGALGMLIDGEWLPRGAAGMQPVIDPATLGVLGELPLAAAGELDRAAQAAHDAFKTWSRTPAIERSRVLAQAAQLMRERAELIAHILTLEQGKPLAESRGEVTGAAEIFEWYAQESRRLYGRVIPARQA